MMVEFDNTAAVDLPEAVLDNNLDHTEQHFLLFFDHNHVHDQYLDSMKMIHK